MHRSRIFIAILAFWFEGCAAHARELTPEVRAMLFSPPHEVSLQRPVVRIALKGTDYNGAYKCPYMQVYVNGRGPFTFLFDTGSSYTTISSKVAAAAHLPVVFDRLGQRDIVRLVDVKIGGVEIHDLWAVHDDNFNVDGIFGFQAFGDRNLLLKLATRELDVSVAPVTLKHGIELPYELIKFTPNILLQVGDRSISTLIDTGDDAYAWEVRSGDIAGVPTLHSPIGAQAVMSGADSSATAVTMAAVPLQLGPLAAENPVVGINDGLAVPDIGYAVQRQFNIAFDQQKRTVTFQPLFVGTHFVVPGNLSLGFIQNSVTGEKITAVVPGLKAAQAGMQAGDRLMSVNGLPPARYSVRGWDKMLAAHKPVPVRWMHGTVLQQSVFAVAEIR